MNVAPEGLFVGRVSELSILRGALSRALSGNGGLCLLVGEAGIGKTRTAAEVAERTDGITAHWARCREGEGAPAFWPWIEVVRALIRSYGGERARSWADSGRSHLMEIFSDLREGVSEHTETGLEEPSSLFQLFDCFATFLRNAADDQPLLIVLDDLHWADRSSLMLLDHLPPMLGEARIMVIGTYRPVEARFDRNLVDALEKIARRATALPLGGLNRTDADQFLRRALGSPLADDVAGLLHDRTKGNLLFLSEVARELAQHPDDTAELAQQLAPTEGIRHAIRRRLDCVSLQCASTLRMAAVIGGQLDLGILRRTCALLMKGPDDVQPASLLDAIDEARRAEILEEGNEPDCYRFSHPLFRDVLEMELSGFDRAVIHRAVAAALESYGAGRDAMIGEIAHHFAAAATLGEVDKAVEYSQLAGEQYRRQHAYEEAASRFSTALRVLDMHSQESKENRERKQLRAKLLIDLGRCQALASTAVDGSEAFRAAAEIGRAIDDSSILAQATLGLVGPAHLGLGGATADARLIEEALEALGSQDHPLRPLLLIRSLVPLYYTQERQLALQRSAEAVAIAERVCDDAILGQVLGERITVLYGPDHVDQRMEMAGRILQIAGQSERRSLTFLGHMWTGLNLLQLGEVDRARAHVDRCDIIAEETRQPFERWQVEVTRAFLQLLRGEFEEAERTATRAAEIGTTASVPNAAIMLSIQIFRIRLEQGRLGEMEPVIVEFARSMPHIPSARGPLALAYGHTGRLDEARRAFEAVAGANFADYPRDANFLTGLTDAAHTCWFLNDRDKAGRLYELLLPHEELAVVGSWFAACSGTVGHYLGLLATVLGRWDAAATHFERAEDHYERMGAAPLKARLQLDHADMLSRCGDENDRAQTRARQAAEALAKLDMPTWQARCADLLDRLGAGRTAEDPAATFPCIFRRDGDFWTIAYASSTTRLKDLKGLHLIRTLLREPGREFHVADLVAAPIARDGAGGEAVPDARARAEYRSRMATLRELLEEAEEHNDLARATRAREEIEVLRDQVAAAYMPSLHARSRNRMQENMRKAVAKNVRTALGRIEARNGALGRHLVNSIQTGVFCSYRPESSLDWLVD